MNTTIAREKVRDSNIELLRIVAMLLVLMVHASFFSLGSPTPSDVQGSPLSSFMRCLSESLSIICVNLFVIISGWFGIKVKIVRLSEFVFQVYFFGILMFLISIILGTDVISIKGCGKVLLSKDLWFVKAYLVLYIFAPVLNTFIEKASKKEFSEFLITYFIIQTLHGFISGSAWFSGGYSPLSFMGLYLLARYIRLYPSKYTKMNKYKDLAFYLMLAISNSLLTLISITSGHGTWNLYAYSSPLVILESLYFFLFFTKIKFHSKIVNWVAISSFAIYLFHCDVHFLVPVYSKIINNWYQIYPTMSFISLVALWIICIFTVSILFDKVRIMIWNQIIKSFNIVKSKASEKDNSLV